MPSATKASFVPEAAWPTLGEGMAHEGPAHPALPYQGYFLERATSAAEIPSSARP
jgi:hypothetical protein